MPCLWSILQLNGLMKRAQTFRNLVFSMVSDGAWCSRHIPIRTLPDRPLVRLRAGCYRPVNCRCASSPRLAGPGNWMDRHRLGGFRRCDRRNSLVAVSDRARCSLRTPLSAAPHRLADLAKPWGLGQNGPGRRIAGIDPRGRLWSANSSTRVVSMRELRRSLATVDLPGKICAKSGARGFLKRRILCW